jgi:hypothetical protein
VRADVHRALRDLVVLFSEGGEIAIELNTMKTTAKKHKKTQVNEAYDSGLIRTGAFHGQQ